MKQFPLDMDQTEMMKILQAQLPADHDLAVKTVRVFPGQSAKILERVVKFSVVIQELPIVPLSPLSYLRVDKRTLAGWLIKSILAGAVLALIFSVLMLAGIRTIPF